MTPNTITRDNTTPQASSKSAIEVRVTPPSQKLQEIIHCYYWTVINPDDSGARHTVARVLPHAAADIIISLGDPLEYDHNGNTGMLQGGVLNGPFLSTPTYRGVGKVELFGARLKHGALGRVLPFEAKRAVNQVITLDNIWDTQICRDALVDPIAKADSFERRVEIAENALAACVGNPRPQDQRLDEAVRLIIESKGRLGVSELAGKLGISRQTLKSKFDQAVGFAPKLFGRLLRFQNTIRVLYKTGRSSWSDLAQECGYYDQAHLIREFNHFTGFSPERLLKDIAQGSSYYYFSETEQTLSVMTDGRMG